MESIITISFFLVVVIVLFLVLRSIVLWYWKVNALLENQNKGNLLLVKILGELKPINPNSEPDEIKLSIPTLNDNTLFLDNLIGKKIVLTGNFILKSENVMIQKLLDINGKVENNLNPNVDFLITGIPGEE